MPSLFSHWFTPHYTNNHRPKLIQPAGLSVVVALFLLVQTTLQLARLSPHLPAGFVLGYASNINAGEVVAQTNAERAKVGLPPLSINEKLNQAALAKAQYMFAHDFWAHIAPDGTTPWSFIKKAGYTYSVAGENLARDFNDTSAMVEAWMNSPTHRDNLVHKKYTNIGVAVVDGKLQGVETTLVVQMFGAPAAAAAQVPTKAAQTEMAAKPQVTEPEPAQVPVPVAEVDIQPVPAPALGIEVTQEDQKFISPLILSKVIGSALVILLALVLVYDLIITSNKNLPRRVGNNWAHLGLLGFILLVILAVTQGKVL